MSLSSSSPSGAATSESAAPTDPADRTPAARLLWQPTDESLAGSSIRRYLNHLAGQGLHFDGYHDLWQWSVDDIPGFWASVWDFFGLGETSSYDTVLAEATMPGAVWFPGATVNFAERCIAGGEPDAAAILGANEAGDASHVMTYRDLERQVASVAATLREAGVAPGDHVAGYLPNVPQAVVALLASAAVGAVWTSAAPEFGTASVLARLEQVAPVVLFAADGYHFGGKQHDRRSEVAEIVASLPSLKAVIDVPVLGLESTTAGQTPRWSWDTTVSRPTEARYEPTAFDHPLWILWSSGTTGTPKGIVHSHGGITLELLKALALGCDLRKEDRYLFVSSTGWMVWNFLVGGLLLGATIICYDGSPSYPDVDGVWALAESTGATVVGVGAAYLLAGQRAGSTPAVRYDLSHVRTVLQTGSTLPDEAWVWTCQKAVPGVWLQSISGGTDICSALVGASPMLPVRLGHICAPVLGAALQAWDESGCPTVGSEGELVVTQPMPSMPLYFVNDPLGARYRHSYFDEYPGVWRHGDWVTIHPDRTITIGGRSDATLNRMGVRLGSADLYGVLDNIPEVEDSLVVGLEEPNGGYYLPLFVTLAPGVELDEQLRAKINGEIRSQLSPRHVPDTVFEVAGIPRTLTGKRLEVPVKRILQGRSAAEVQSGAVTHPDMLAWFEAHGRSRAGRA